MDDCIFGILINTIPITAARIWGSWQKAVVPLVTWKNPSKSINHLSASRSEWQDFSQTSRIEQHSALGRPDIYDMCYMFAWESPHLRSNLESLWAGMHVDVIFNVDFIDIYYVPFCILCSSNMLFARWFVDFRKSTTSAISHGICSQISTCPVLVILFLQRALFSSVFGLPQ